MAAMQGEEAGRPRFGWLEGLRGVAAIQVVALHVVQAFLPHWEGRGGPLEILQDGHVAVYLFFLLSGAVLTLSFQAQPGFLAQTAKRVVRLGLPVAAAAGLAALLLAAWPQAHVQAAHWSGSTWLATDSSGPASARQVIRETFVESMLTGYADTTLLPDFAAAWLNLDPLARSLDTPLWTLHYEFYGSLMVFGLVALRRRTRLGHAAAVGLMALLFGAQTMFLFVLGHLAAGWLGTKRPARPVALAAGLVLLAAGVALCARKDWGAVADLRLLLDRVLLVRAPNLFQFGAQLAAVVLFAAPLLAPPLRRALETSVPRRLGRLSFGIYLLHFPILFTLGCLAFTALHGLPQLLAAALAVAVVAAVTLPAAALFERWIDRPAIALARRIGRAVRGLPPPQGQAAGEPAGEQRQRRREPDPSGDADAAAEQGEDHGLRQIADG
jgi:peptidoglycan/LPS O-acetylase OafA/YrhL